MSVSSGQVKAAHVTLRLEETLIQELRDRAKRNDRSVSAEARVAIRQYLDIGRDKEQEAA